MRTVGEVAGTETSGLRSNVPLLAGDIRLRPSFVWKIDDDGRCGTTHDNPSKGLIFLSPK